MATPAPEPAKPAPPAEPMPVTGAELRATAILLGFFVVTILLAVLLAGPSMASGLQQFEDPEDPVNVLWYVLLILGFTFLILWIAKRGWKWAIRLLILLAVGSSILFVAYPLLSQTAGMGFEPAFAVSVVAALLVTLALWKHPEWYVIDTAGLLVAAGAASVFGISFVPWLVVLLLAVLAVYDAIAVYRTKHMLSLADTVIELRLPVLLVIPKHGGYRFRDDAAKMKQATQTNKQEREAMFMGLGDLVMPTILVVSALVFLPAHAQVLQSQLGDVRSGGDVPLLLTVEADHDPDVGKRGALQAMFILSSTHPEHATLEWTLDWDADDRPDDNGTGLPATVFGTYEQPGAFTVRATAATPEGDEGTLEQDLDVREPPGPWHQPIARFLQNGGALGAALGTIAGYLVLMVFVLRGNPQAGLPLLNGGAILGFLVGLYAQTGSLRFW